MDASCEDTLVRMSTFRTRELETKYLEGKPLPATRLTEIACLRMYGPRWLAALRAGRREFIELLQLAGGHPDRATKEALRWFLCTAGSRERVPLARSYTVGWTLLPAYALRKADV